MNLKDALNRMESPPEAAKRLSGARNPLAIRAATRTEQNAGSGIASPLREADYAARTWHPAQTFTSTDGIFTFSVRFLESVSFTDANGVGVVLEYQDKP